MRRLYANTVLANLKCIECGQIFPIQRQKGRKKKVNEHIKTLYCIKCRKNTKHLEIEYP